MDTMTENQIRKVYVRYNGDLPANESIFAARQGFHERGVECVPYYGFDDKALSDVGPEVAVVGYVGDVLGALREAGYKQPEPMDYPECLHKYLGRTITRTTLGDVRYSTTPVFVKPVRHKLFTGFVWERGRADRLKIAPYEDSEPVWTSEVVELNREYRAFVGPRGLLGVKQYKGEYWSIGPDYNYIYHIIGDMMTTKGIPCAYSLDIGMSDKGKIYLVEANDAFALGHYGLARNLYVDMISARWKELTSPENRETVYT